MPTLVCVFACYPSFLSHMLWLPVVFVSLSRILCKVACCLLSFFSFDSLVCGGRLSLSLACYFSYAIDCCLVLCLLPATSCVFAHCLLSTCLPSSSSHFISAVARYSPRWPNVIPMTHAVVLRFFRPNEYGQVKARQNRQREMEADRRRVEAIREAAAAEEEERRRAGVWLASLISLCIG